MAHFQVQKRLPLDHILNQVNLFHTLTFYTSDLFNTTLPSASVRIIDKLVLISRFNLPGKFPLSNTNWTTLILNAKGRSIPPPPTRLRKRGLKTNQHLSYLIE